VEVGVSLPVVDNVPVVDIGVVNVYNEAGGHGALMYGDLSHGVGPLDATAVLYM